MHTELFSVFERDGDQVGIGEFGSTRTLIHTSGGSVIATKSIQLHELGPHIAALKRSGFSHNLSGAFFNERVARFSTRHSDFAINSYLVFVQHVGDVQQAVSAIEAIGLRYLVGERRKHFNDWLRSLDLSCDYLVATTSDPAPVLALCEYAREKSLCIFTSSPGIPVTKPSSDKLGWLKWLGTYFSESTVQETIDQFWPSRVIHQSALHEPEDPSDLLSYQF